MSTPVLAVAAGTWNLDAIHSRVDFEVPYLAGTFKGEFHEIGAELTVEGERASLEGTAKVASVDVKDEQLSGHLQTPDFFDAARYPEIAFRATSLERLGGDRVEGSGELTIKGTTQPINVTGAVAAAPATDPFGRERLGLRLETSIDRTQYGVSWNMPNQSGGDYVANDVHLIAELAFVKAEA